MSLFLLSGKEVTTKFEIPGEAGADVTLRRLQNFQLKPGTPFQWTFGTTTGDGKTDAQGIITITGLKITGTPVTLSVTR